MTAYADERNAQAKARVTELISSTTQRQWLNACRALDLTRDRIKREAGLAFAYWLQECREHGGCSWDRVLDMTDEQLADALGFVDDDTEEPIAEVEHAPATV